jgi:hypothetical protein
MHFRDFPIANDQLVKMSVLLSAEFPAGDFAEPLLKSFDASVVESLVIGWRKEDLLPPQRNGLFDAGDYEGATIIAGLQQVAGRSTSRKVHVLYRLRGYGTRPSLKVWLIPLSKEYRRGR